MNIEKSIFISYRRSTSKHLARLIYNALTQHEYDVFFDVSTLDNGQFDTVILNQIAARPHFIVVLSPGAFARCVNPDGTENRQDWLRIEIEHAIDLERNIVPLIEEGFSFETERAYLTGKLGELPRYNGVKLIHEFFDPAMDMLRTRFLKVSIKNIAVKPTPAAERSTVARKKAAIQQDDPVAAVQRIIAEVNRSPLPNIVSLWKRTQAEAQYQLIIDNSKATIEKYTKILKLNPRHDKAYYMRGSLRREKGNLDNAIADQTKAIRLNPQYTDAYFDRGLARYNKNDFDGAITDYSEVIRLNPKSASAFNNRGLARRDKGDLDGAIADYTEAIRLNPKSPDTYSGRGLARRDKGDLDGAIADYTEAIHLNPQFANAHFYRGLLRGDKGDLDNAIADYTETIRLNPQDASAYNNRGEIYFISQKYQLALSDFSQSDALRPDHNFVLAGIAISAYVLGSVVEAQNLWQRLIQQDSRYRDLEWVRTTLNWADPLVKTARNLIATLPE